MNDLFDLLRRFGWLTVFTIPVLLLGCHYWDRLNKIWRTVLFLACCALIALSGAVLALKMRNNIATPPHFDFQLFWTYGRTAVEHRNPYDQQQLIDTAKTIATDEGDLAELYFLYPPGTLLLFAPLGLTDLRSAAVGWQVFLILSMILNTVILWRLFARGDGPHAFLLTTVLFLMFHPTYQTVHFAQTNFLLLLCVLLFWIFRERWVGGAALGVGILVKPFLGLMPLYLLVRRRWAALCACIVTGTVLTLGAASLLGANLLASYIWRNPIAHDMPDKLYTEKINQSLLATLLRWTHFDLSINSPYALPLFWVFAGMLGAATVVFIIRAREENDDWAVALLLNTSLLVYPKTLEHYCLLLIVPLFLIWQDRDRLPGGPWLAAVAIGTAYAGVATHQAFFTLVLVWLILVVMGSFPRPTPNAAERGAEFTGGRF